MTAFVHKCKILSSFQVVVIVKVRLDQNRFAIQEEKGFIVVVFKYLHSEFPKRCHSENASIIGKVHILNRQSKYLFEH